MIPNNDPIVNNVTTPLGVTQAMGRARALAQRDKQ